MRLVCCGCTTSNKFHWHWHDRFFKHMQLCRSCSWEFNEYVYYKLDDGSFWGSVSASRKTMPTISPSVPFAISRHVQVLMLSVIMMLEKAHQTWSINSLFFFHNIHLRKLLVYIDGPIGDYSKSVTENWNYNASQIGRLGATWTGGNWWKISTFIAPNDKSVRFHSESAAEKFLASIDISTRRIMRFFHASEGHSNRGKRHAVCLCLF